MARAPCCSDKAAALMVSAGLAVGRSVVKSTSCRLYTWPKSPHSLRAGAGKCDGEQPAGRRGWEGAEHGVI